MFSLPVKPEFHLNARQLKLINLDSVARVNVHENGVSIIAHRLGGAMDTPGTDVNLDWDQVEQLYISLANALSLRNIRTELAKLK